MLINEAQDTPDDRLDTVQPSPVATGWLSLFQGGNALVSVMIAAGVAIHALSMRVVSTAFPVIVTEIGGLRFFAWTMTVAVVSAIWGAAFSASLVRSQGLRNAYRISLMVFAAGSAGCALAPNIGIFLAGRLFQGLGGGLLTSLSYLAIRRVFPENLRTRAIVVLSSVWGAAAFAGPMLGGALAGWGFWRWAFWIDLPFAAAAGILVEVTLSKSAEPESERIAARAKAACVRLGLLTGSAFAVSVGGLTSNASLGGIGLVLGLAMLVVLVRLEQAPGGGTSLYRLLPSGAYQPGNVLGAVSLAMALMVGATTATVLYVPYVATEIGGFPPIVGGYLGALVSISWTFSAFLTASAEGVWVARSVITGSVCICLGQACAAYALRAGSFSLMAVGICLAGSGVGIAWAHLSNLMMAHAKKTEHDVSSTFIYTNQMIATALFSALAGTIANITGFAHAAHGATGVVRSISWLFLSLAFIAAASMPVSVAAVRLSAATRSDQQLAKREHRFSSPEASRNRT